MTYQANKNTLTKENKMYMIIINGINIHYPDTITG